MSNVSIKSTTVTDPKTKQIWRMQYIANGDKYGRDDCLTHDKEPMVEFYDMANALTFGERGQFVTRYYISSLRDDDYVGYVDKGNRHHLDLMGYEPTWKVSAPMMDLVMTWLTEVEGGAAMNNELFIERVRAVIGNEPELLKLATEADATIRDLTERLEKFEGDKP
tara:strand:+ start:1879 stop:2376 length:498 start_codon:yes stop_codon:yes gene_type:complete